MDKKQHRTGKSVVTLADNPVRVKPNGRPSLHLELSLDISAVGFILSRREKSEELDKIKACILEAVLEGEQVIDEVL